MLGRANRLTRERDFEGVYRRGQRFAGRYALVRLLANRLPVVRVGIVASTKLSKLATVRNAHKRHARVAIRAVLAQLPPGWDIVVTLKSLVQARADWPQFEEEIRDLVTRRFLS